MTENRYRPHGKRETARQPQELSLVWIIYAEKHNIPIEHYEIYKDTVGYAFHKLNFALKQLKHEVKKCLNISK